MDRVELINGRELRLTNLEKIYWPEDGFSKSDLIEYYRGVAKYILPYLKDRPESLHRFPNGIKENGFYQKNLEDHPEWVKTVSIWSESNQENINYVVCDNEETLIYLVNLGCIELNVWSSRIEMLNFPDYLVIDLDPEDIEFEKVIKVALTTKRILDSAKVSSFVKTSGATGLHIFVPLKAKYDYDTVKNFAKVVALLVNHSLPDITSLERSPQKRQKRVYLDYLQNNYGATMAAPYTVRPKNNATVSMPLEWSELKNPFSPEDFTMKNAIHRIKRNGDTFLDVLNKSNDIENALERLNRLS